ncbi:putative addiction module antidote protein [Pseudomonas sp. 3296]|jgi:probable addiction module antidote protein|uniref:addiction module antidote protein n=1 Tax=Pseudomonas sp. 3296 TaxID=2817753 RepID=UPI00285D0001|nr:putative addiction module antidote protein [Pseudomonas sp. 3296]
MRQSIISGQGQVVDPIADKELARHLESCFRESDPGLLPGALRHIAQFKGFTELSRDTGIRRTTLYRLLSRDAAPSFSDILKVTRALGFKLRVEALSALEAQNNESQ